MPSDALVRVNSKPLVAGLVGGAVAAGLWQWHSPDTVEQVSNLVTAFVSTFAVIAVSIVPFTDRDRGADLIRRAHALATRLGRDRDKMSDRLTRFGVISGVVGGFALTSSVLSAAVADDGSGVSGWWAGSGILSGFVLALLLATIGRGQVATTSDGGSSSGAA